ncbi:hypothetical protein HanIR_Chr12g0562401 [Helianthus annuus]|nr:hypothetical protein HanIR_Chr12g0562401 [Helianthus annuus]
MFFVFKYLVIKVVLYPVADLEERFRISQFFYRMFIQCNEKNTIINKVKQIPNTFPIFGFLKLEIEPLLY